MEQKAFVLQNTGMNRDLSISKVGQSSAFENHNIRITARDHDTLLSVTNERGTKLITFSDLSTTLGGKKLVGWNVLNEHIIVFMTVERERVADSVIYRIDYYPENEESQKFDVIELYRGNLGFSTDYPIESVVYHESDSIQKIYWVDGIHVLRFMNFMASAEERQSWIGDDTVFDSNRRSSFGVSVDITKDNSGNTRPNGTVQYLLTYYNKFGQESGYVWISDLVYLAPSDRGGAPDETNNNRITLTINGMSTDFTNYRVYSIVRSSLDGAVAGYIVADGETTTEKVVVVDDGAHLTVEDANRLLYLGSQPVVAGTLAHKDQTLFIGDIRSSGKGNYEALKEAIDTYMFNSESAVGGRKWESSCVEFIYSDNNISEIHHIPYVLDEGEYSYSNQLQLTSSQISGFKGGEKYRFALKFQLDDGTDTEAFWIGDKENTLYPVISRYEPIIKRVVVRCTIPSQVVALFGAANIKTAQLMIAQATYSDRAVKAQGIVNPTMFNTWERFKERLYSVPSWMTRVRNTTIPSTHFTPLDNSVNTSAEVICNYWDDGVQTPSPMFHIDSVDSKPYEDYESLIPDYEFFMIVYQYRTSKEWDGWHVHGRAFVIKAKMISGSDEALKNYADFDESDIVDAIQNGDTITVTITENNDTVAQFKYWIEQVNPRTYAPAQAWVDIQMELQAGISGNNIAIDSKYVLNTEQSYALAQYSAEHGEVAFSTNWKNFNEHKGGSDSTYYIVENGIKDYTIPHQVCNAANQVSSGGTLAGRWQSVSEDYGNSRSFSNQCAYYNKGFMFVDENVVSFNSPEIEYANSVSDNANYKFRIVGAAKMTNVISDYTVDASHGRLSGNNLLSLFFSKRLTDSNTRRGITAWPLWRDYGLQEKPTAPPEIIKRTPDDYDESNVIVRYWLYMWHRCGIISSYPTDGGEISRKVFANLSFSYATVFAPMDDFVEYGNEKICVSEDNENQYISLSTDIYNGYYSGSPQFALTMPGNKKYPLLYTDMEADPDSDITNNYGGCFLYSNEPVIIEYATRRHAIVSLGFDSAIEQTRRYYNLLPCLFVNEFSDAAYGSIIIDEGSNQRSTSPAIVPWSSLFEDTLFVDVVDIHGVHSYYGSYETFSVTHNYDPATGKISLSLFEYEDDPHSPPLKELIDSFRDAFNAAMKKHDTESIYTLVQASDSYFYIVRINDYSYLHVEGSYTKIELNDADVLIRYPIRPGSEQSIFFKVIQATVHTPAYAEYDNYDVDIEEYPGEWILEADGTIHLFSDTAHTQYAYYDVNRSRLELESADEESILIKEKEPYVLIGEIYEDINPQSDMRYGGISDSAIESNRFIVAGPQYAVSDSLAMTIYGNQGDTFFQRWDSLRTKPFSDASVNNVIDIASFMVETHVNIDGRYDKQRGSKTIASIDTAKFGQVNSAYSQTNDFFLSRDLDNDKTFDAYRNAITWTLQKSDMASIDEWTHITLANSLKLDGDKGVCQALRRFQNRLIAFQDRGISEILFNSRTQLTTTDGTPIEIANSGKVDGKNYITNKYGSVNKWAIVEGKNGLYFVDNVNKAFCVASFPQGGKLSIDNLSTKLGFSSWFRNINSVKPWIPDSDDNIVAHYDKVHSDIYLVKSVTSDKQPCLVYSETLGSFTSFFDYRDVPMMVNVEDKFISFHDNKLWLQNEGMYGMFFGVKKPFWMQYRVTPEPYADKIWTNIEYRADFYNVLNNDGTVKFDEDDFMQPNLLTPAVFDSLYDADETFDFIQVWNEYQQTGMQLRLPVEKKFRIWRYTIPRATGGTGLDRIRNPWVNILFRKDAANFDEKQMMQLHDVIVKYFE